MDVEVEIKHETHTVHNVEAYLPGETSEIRLYAPPGEATYKALRFETTHGIARLVLEQCRV